MSWAHPHLLWLLAGLAALALLDWSWRRAVRRRRAGVGAGVTHLTRGVGRGRERLRAMLLWLGLAGLVVSLAGPRWGAHDDVQANHGADVLLVLDCSRSMLAKDLYPDRLEAARRKAIDLLRLAPETRLALMPFAAVPVLRCPLTGDHHAIEQMLRDCSPELFPAEDGYQGTAIGEAVKAGLQVLGRQVERGQSILVMSDGADDDQAAVEAGAQAAVAAGVRVYGLFFGDPERQVTVSIDGREEIMHADRSTLDRLATATGGLCVNASGDTADMTLIHDHLRTHVAQLPWEERRRIVQSERYQLALLPAMLLLAGGLLIPTRRRRES
jgi:Ca-activated chloride channel family protein